MTRCLRRTFFAVLLLLVPLCTAAQDTAKAWVETIESPLYVAVLVEDMDRAVAWYQTVFGLQAVGGSEAEDGSWRIENLWNEQLFVELIRGGRAQKVDRATGFFKVGFQVPDVEAVADRVAEAMGERPRVIDFPDYGIRIMQIKDPEGNTIQLCLPLPPTEE